VIGPKSKLAQSMAHTAAEAPIVADGPAAVNLTIVGGQLPTSVRRAIAYASGDEACVRPKGTQESFWAAWRAAGLPPNAAVKDVARARDLTPSYVERLVTRYGRLTWRRVAAVGCVAPDEAAAGADGQTRTKIPSNCMARPVAGSGRRASTRTMVNPAAAVAASASGSSIWPS
jgi:hypothetical protein